MYLFILLYNKKHNNYVYKVAINHTRINLFYHFCELEIFKYFVLTYVRSSSYIHTQFIIYSQIFYIQCISIYIYQKINIVFIHLALQLFHLIESADTLIIMNIFKKLFAANTYCMHKLFGKIIVISLKWTLHHINMYLNQLFKQKSCNICSS